jgi:hypothetical protein
VQRKHCAPDGVSANRVVFAHPKILYNPWTRSKRVSGMFSLMPTGSLADKLPPPAKPSNCTSFHYPTWLPPQFCTDTGSKTWTTGFETDLRFLLVVCGSEMRGAGPGSFCASLYSIGYPTSQPFMPSFNHLQKEAFNIPPQRPISKFPMNTE